MSRKFGFQLLAIGVLGLTLGSVAQLSANHQWGCFHWPGPDINVANKAQGDYYYIYQEETWTDSDSWDAGTKLNLTLSDPGKPDLRLNSGTYGFNGWLGLAQIWFNGCVITRAVTKLNDTYLSASFYTRDMKKHVACQEVGHSLGLDHNAVDLDTCMNDTIPLNAPHPNQHDFDMVNLITP